MQLNFNAGNAMHNAANQVKNAQGGKKGGGKKNNGPGHPKFYGGVGAYRGVPYSRAAGIVNAQIRRMMDDLRREADKARTMHQQDRREARQLYRRSKGDLNHIFGEVNEQIGSSNRAISDTYSGAMERGQASTAELLGQQSAQTSAAKAAASEELARLGIQGSGNLGQMDADAAFSQQMASQAGANNQANLGLANSMAGDIGNLLSGMAAGSHQSNMGKALNTRNDEISNSRDAKRMQLMDIWNQMRDVQEQRGGMINELLEQMLAGDFDRWMGVQGLRMDRRALNASLGGGSGSSGGYGSSGSGSPSTAGWTPMSVNPNPHNPGQQPNIIQQLLGGGKGGLYGAFSGLFD